MERSGSIWNAEKQFDMFLMIFLMISSHYSVFCPHSLKVTNPITTPLSHLSPGFKYRGRTGESTKSRRKVCTFPSEFEELGASQVPQNAQRFHLKIAFLLPDLSCGNKRVTNSEGSLYTSYSNCISLFPDFTVTF